MTMTSLTLPGPEGPVPLPLTLALVETLEEAGGPLLRLAARLLTQDLPVADMMRVLRAAYRFGGCTAAEDTLDAFLLRRAPPALLAEVLHAVLAPLHAAGAVAEENSTAGE